MGTHTQKRIKHGEMEADVDVAIAPLILELWRAGWETSWSCQEQEDGRAAVGFEDVHHAEAFLAVAVGTFPHDLIEDDAYLAAIVPGEEIDVNEVAVAYGSRYLETIFNRINGNWASPDDREAFHENRVWEIGTHPEVHGRRAGDNHRQDQGRRPLPQQRHRRGNPQDPGPQRCTFPG